jgi:selenocysteine lyase/cysteine desulfurase
MEAPGIGLGLKNSVRPSLAFDNPREEVDTLLSALRPLK